MPATTVAPGQGAHRRHVRQRNTLDCGVATSAILAGIPYDAASPPEPLTRGYWVREMLDSLARVGCIGWKETRRGYGKPLRAFATLPPRCAVILRPKGKRFGHWVAVHEGLIHDPERPAPRSVDQYDRRDWIVIRVLIPS